MGREGYKQRACIVSSGTSRKRSAAHGPHCSSNVARLSIERGKPSMSTGPLAPLIACLKSSMVTCARQNHIGRGGTDVGITA